MTPDALAEIALRAYRHMTPWSEADFAEALEQPATLLAAGQGAFVLGRVIADEAEIFAVATDPARQRQGAAGAALARFEAQAVARGAVQVFLEVAAKNEPAQRFYEAAGYAVTGRRRGYYPRPDGSRDDALLMTKALT